MSCEIAKLFPVSEQQKEDILKEFGKTQADVADDVIIIREWLKKQPQIPEMDDTFIAKVLILNKFRVEKTKIKIDNYFASKNIYADFYESLDPTTPEMIKSAKYTFAAYLPKLTPNNSRVYFWTMRLSADEDYDSKSIVRLSTLIAETRFLYDDSPNTVAIFDAIGFGMAQFFKLDMNIQSKMMNLLFEAFSGRLEAMHTVNVSVAAEKAMNLFKPLFPSKIRDRMFFHSSYDTLHKIIPKDCLPSEVGGTGPSGIEVAKQIAAVLQNDKDNILKRNKIATNEKLRIGDPPMRLDMFGVDGTFKKITLD